MALCDPEPGLVIRYPFLWSHEKQAGLAQGSKFRPVVVLTVKKTEDLQQYTVFALPITHLEPKVVGIEHLPISEQERIDIGLDAEPQWFVLNELNRFSWNPRALGFIPGTPKQHYGYLPKATLLRIRGALKQLDEQRKRFGIPKVSLIGRV